MSHKTIFIILGAALFLVASVAGYYGPDWLERHLAESRKKDFVAPGVPVSAVASFETQFSRLDKAVEPQFLPDMAFVDTAGKTVRISDFAGKPALVNFWATWCTPCVVELPSLQALQKAYEGRLQVVGIAVEDSSPAAIKRFLEGRQLGAFAGYLDSTGGFMRDLRLFGIPTSFLIGSDGAILYRFEGDADWASPQAREFFDIFILQNR